MGNWCTYYFSHRKELTGGKGSLRPSTEDDSFVKELSDSTGFTYRQVEELQKRFNELIRHRIEREVRYNTLKPEDLLMIPEFKRNPLNKRIADVFFSYAKDQRSMNFEEFIEVLSKFRSYARESKSIYKEKTSEKLAFIFRIYDTDNSGYITLQDLCETIKAALPKGGLSNAKIVQTASQMITEMDRDGDGRISFDDYCKSLEDIDIDSKINLPFLNRRI